MTKAFESFNSFDSFIQQASISQYGNPGWIGETSKEKSKIFIKSKRKRKPKS
jgi:hypothetical protein